MKLIRLFKLLFVILILLFHSGTWAKDGEGSNVVFLSVADIHFDPFASCSVKPCEIIQKLKAATYQDWEAIFAKYDSKTLATYSHDSNYALLANSLIELDKINKQDKPQFVVILGDLLAHNFRKNYIKFTGDKSRSGFRDFVKKTMQFLTKELNTVFSNTSVYTIEGNNDSYTGNYHIVPEGKFFKDTAIIWSLLIKDKANRNKFLSQFQDCGYYSIMLNDNLQLIMLNTVLFSNKAKGADIHAAAKKELKWLSDQLNMAVKNKNKVIIAYHIPTEYTANIILYKQLGLSWQFWKAEYRQEYENILKNFIPSIVAVLPAHVHIESSQFHMTGPLSKVTEIFTPSISPIYGNDPGFQVIYYDPNEGRIIRHDTYKLNKFNSDSMKWQSS